MAIGFAAPREQYLAHKMAIDDAIERVLHADYYILGQEVEAFEAEFAAYCGVDHAVGVGNGTDALHLALRALEIGTGDEVITTAMTAVATVAAIEMSGAKAVFVDIKPENGIIDDQKIAAAITNHTRAIIPVHLYGHAANMAAIMKIAEAHELAVIEDCAQATGGAIAGQKLGSFGILGCFSFYPTKNLGAIGDGGAVITNDAALAERLRGLRQYGWQNRQISKFPGYNSRLDALQAAILRAKLPYLDEDNEIRQEIAAYYVEKLTHATPLRLPKAAAKTHPVWHLFVVGCQSAGERQKLKDFLTAHGIYPGIHYPMPIYLQPAYRPRYKGLSLPATEAWGDSVLSLPIYPELPVSEVDRVIAMVCRFYGKN